MRSFSLIIFSVVLCLVADTSRADLSGFYIGAALGNAKTRETFGFGHDYDDRDSAYKVIGGWRPLDWFAIEGSYFDLGSVALRRNVPDLAPFSLDQRGYAGHAVFLLEIARFDLFGKMGIVRSKADFTSSSIIGPVSWTDRDTDFGWGFGGQLRFEHVAARLEVERFHISNGDGFRSPQLISLGVTWRFPAD